MVIGTGMIGTALEAVDRNDVLFCASGVSNAQGHVKAACQREEALLKQQIGMHTDKTILYISSYSINDTETNLNSPYLQHKKEMEALVKSLAHHYVIVRTSNVVGCSKQPGNLLNFIYQHLQSATPFDIWTQTARNLIDVQHLAAMVGAYLEQGPLDQTIYLMGPTDSPIVEIVQLFETALGIQGHYRLIPKGTYYNHDKKLSEHLWQQIGIDSKDYIQKLIQKYFLNKTQMDNAAVITPDKCL